jgi:hypothetical protein
MRQHRAEWNAGHGRCVDDGGFAVASHDVCVSRDAKPCVRSEIDVAGATVGNDACRSRCLVEQHVRDIRRNSRGEGRVREHGADVGVAQLMSNLGRCGERIDQHCATPFTRGERGEKARRRRQENGGAFSAERANERRASLQEREAGCHEPLYLVLVDVSVVRREG